MPMPASGGPLDVATYRPALLRLGLGLGLLTLALGAWAWSERGMAAALPLVTLMLAFYAFLVYQESRLWIEVGAHGFRFQLPDWDRAQGTSLVKPVRRGEIAYTRIRSIEKRREVYRGLGLGHSAYSLVLASEIGLASHRMLLGYHIESRMARLLLSQVDTPAAVEDIAARAALPVVDRGTVTISLAGGRPAW